MLKIIKIAVAIVGIAFTANAQENKYEKTILGFEKTDLAQPINPKNLIVFTGSSSIVNWKTLAEDFPTKNIINRGFGGSTTTDLLHFADRVISVYQPKQVFIYEGDNDLKGKKTPAEVFANFKLLFDQIRAKSKHTRISFISIKPSPSRRDLLNKISTTNALIAEFLKTQKNTDYIDVFTPMFPKQQFIPSFYKADSLHMTAAGYEIWKKVVKPYLK